MLNAGRYPRASAYVAQLPEGLGSFPACRAKYDALEILLGRCPSLAQDLELPAPIREAIVAGAGAWQSEVVTQTISLMARDAVFGSDAEFLRFNYELSSQLFNRTLYRALMRLVSPSLLLMGASRRWSTFRTGSDLRPTGSNKEGGRVHGSVLLTHPPGIFPALFLQSLCDTFRAALDLSRGRGVKVSLGEQAAGSTHYLVSWEA